MWQLKEKKLIPSDSVFILGHLGFFAGSCIPNRILELGTINKGEIMNSIFNIHFSLHDLDKDSKTYK